MFLQTVANDLYQKYDGDFRHLTIVFPNKRASLFFNKEIVKLAGRPVWTPAYTSIGELFRSMSPLTVADPILLICQLFRIYQRVSGSQETLDHFYSWGEIMLSDFEDVDNNMADATRLFHNIENLSDLTDSDYLSENQVQAIQQFFHNFNPVAKTELKERFLSIWNMLQPIYQQFRDALRQQHYAYEGMLKRDVIEHWDDSLLDQQMTYAFVGFNVLSKSEQQLFKHLRDSGHARFYWDYDHSYIGQQTEAGRFISENLQHFPNELPSDADCYHQFSTDKHITYVASPTETAQAHYICPWLEHLSQEIGTDTAIVLCNEAITQSVLHSIPTSTSINVTMGLPLQQTPVASFIDVLLDLQLHGRAHSAAWRYSYVANVLHHPFTLRLAGNSATELINDLQQHNVMYPEQQRLTVNEFLQTLFQPQTDNISLMRYLADILHSLGRSMTRQEDQPLNVEAVFNAYTIVNRLISIHETGLLSVSQETLARLLRQIIRGKSIPFHGEPAEGLQIMGILETRNLDFRNILMLSTNEGYLPRPDHRSSFIPYNLREAYGMTTIERQNSLYAYYFYRLLQRTKNATLVYNSSTDGLSRGEMSRFMMQLLTERPGIVQTAVTAGSSMLQPHAYSVTKTPAVIQRLRQLFDWSQSRSDGQRAMTLTPTSLNTYINCPLQFYLHYVAALRTDEDVSEEVGNDMFGTLFHYCMEHIYKDVFGLGREIQSHELLQLAQQQQTLSALVDEAFNVEYFKKGADAKHQQPRYNGEQLLNRQVIITYVKKQLQYDATRCPLTVICTEDHSHSAYIDFPLHTSDGTPDGTVRLRLGGTIDRIDCVTSGNVRQIRIVDYKTSASEQKATTIDQLFDPTQSRRAYHLLQALYYCDVVSLSGQDPWTKEPLQPALMYVKIAREQNMGITDYRLQVHDEYHNRLLQLIGDIFNPSIPFCQSPSTHHCQYCDFADFCMRK